MDIPSALGLPYGRALRRSDLQVRPNDGHRYELIDGSLVVTPLASAEHEQVLMELLMVLYKACPEGMLTLPGPVELALGPNTLLAPDIVVAVEHRGRRATLSVPVLAVEVVDDPTRHLDLELKRWCYADAECPSYWLVDPLAPAITAWELRDGAYVVTGQAVGRQSLTVTQPFPVSVMPAQLMF